MAIKYNGTSITNKDGVIKYNGTTLKKVIYNGVCVYGASKWLFKYNYVSNGITGFDEDESEKPTGSLGKITLSEGNYLQIQSGWISGQSLGNIHLDSNKFSRGSYTRLYYTFKTNHKTLSTTTNCYSKFIVGSKKINILPSKKDKWETFTGYVDISSMGSSISVRFEHDCGIYGNTSPVYSYIRIYELYLA